MKVRMRRRIPGWGLTSSRGVIIGEAGGEQEALRQIPFVGATGHLLVEWLTAFGMRRSQFFIDNVFPFRPAYNSNNLSLVSTSELEMWAENLHERIAALDNPKLIVAAGEVAFRALMRSPLRDKKSPKIDDWRGSILKYEDNRGRSMKLIGTIHPARTFYDKSLVKLCLADWHRISCELQTSKRRHPKFQTHIYNGSREMQRLYHKFCELADSSKSECAVDIETDTDAKIPPRLRKILCVAFTFDGQESLTFPWTERNFLMIKRLCESRCQKIMQNGYGYDDIWLIDRGVKLRNYIWDLLGMHHALDATLPHALHQQESLYGRHRFWKKDAKDSDSGGKALAFSRGNKLYRYNGVDVCITWRLKQRHHRALQLGLMPDEQLFQRTEDLCG